MAHAGLPACNKTGGGCWRAVTGYVSRHSLSAGRPALVPIVLSVLLAAFSRRLLVPLALLALLGLLARLARLLLAVVLLCRLTLVFLLPVLLLVLVAHSSLLG